MEHKEAYEKIRALKDNLGRAIKGKPEAVDLTLTALLARGHLLIEDVPGVGKTTLAHALARSINAEFQRIQFTSDLLPSDVLGVTVYRQSDHAFEFKKGPIFANIVLADEVNRATPKTQSALLEAMSDRQVSVDKATYDLPTPFMLLATQNPLEYSGTFPLPESQLDRFMMCIMIGYPEEAEERKIIMSGDTSETVPVVSASDIEDIQAAADGVKVDEDLVGYILAIANSTRRHRGIRLGVSPRATKSLYRAVQAHALVSGRDYVIPDDIKTLAVPAFAHRIIPSERTGSDATGQARSLIEDVLSGLSVPV